MTEELVFRSTILSVSILARLSSKSLIFGTPLWFGLAHAHHAVEVYRRSGGGREAAVKAIGGCGGFSSPSDNGSQLMGGKTVFQFGYTTLFGWFASYLFLRTGTFTLLFMTDPSPSTSATSHSEQNGDADLGMAAIAGSILPPLLSHMFCNFMGIYLPTNAVRRHPRRRARNSPAPVRLTNPDRVPVIWGAYVAGVLGFVVGLRAL